jgi:hypothetical protein
VQSNRVIKFIKGQDKHISWEEEEKEGKGGGMV